MLDNDTPTNNSIPYGYCYCGCGEKTAISKKSETRYGWVKGEPRRFIHGHHARLQVSPPSDPLEWDDGLKCYRVPLSSKKYPGLYALIDEADFDLVGQYRWHPKVGCGRATYAATSKTGVRMHRLIMSAPSDLEVDHINGNGLDNRKSNLRLATISQNQANRKNLDVGSSSKYRGVNWQRSVGRWQASIKVRQKYQYLGVFHVEEDAARAYDDAARKHFGEFANTNFTAIAPEGASDE